MKRRLLLVLATLILVFGLVACGNTTDDTNANETGDANTEANADGDDVGDAEELTGELTWDMPEGFECSQESNGYTYYTHKENTSAANINYVTRDKDGSLDTLTAAMLADQTKADLEEDGLENVEITIVTESREKINGRTALTYEINYKVNEALISHIQTIVENGDKYEYFTFTWFDYEEGYEDALRASAASIRFE